MADNVTADAGTGGAVLAADDISSVFYPRAKISLGADGTAVDAVGGTGVDTTGVMRVSLATDIALPAGTNEIGKLAAGTAAIGKLAANSGVDIGDVTLNAGTAEIGKLAAGLAEIGNVKNSGTFATQATLQAGTAEIGKLAAGTAEIGKLAAGTAAIGKLAANSGVDIGDVTLTAGTAAIGKLAANTGVDIGDVDVTSLVNSSINGAAEPSIDSYTNIALNLSAAANQSLVVAPGASKQIWVYGVGFSVDTAATSVSFQDEDDTAISGIMIFAQYGGMSVSPAGNFAMPLWKVATNKALEVDLVTGGFDGWLAYGIASV